MVVIAVLIGIARAGLEGLVVVALHRGEGPSVSPRQITSSHTKQGIARTYLTVEAFALNLAIAHDEVYEDEGCCARI